jgi:hypothetical protein
VIRICPRCAAESEPYRKMVGRFVLGADDGPCKLCDATTYGRIPETTPAPAPSSSPASPRPKGA